MRVAPATARDRLAYRVMVWAHTPKAACGCPSYCLAGLPGCAITDWMMRFEELGWITLPDPHATPRPPRAPEEEG